jgi:hypothetical protein
MKDFELSYESVLRVVHTWPAEQRYMLVHDLLKGMAPDEQGRLRVDTLPQALGLLRTDQPPPSDEEVARWLHEHRTEKYESYEVPSVEHP